MSGDESDFTSMDGPFGLKVYTTPRPEQEAVATASWLLRLLGRTTEPQSGCRYNLRQLYIDTLGSTNDAATSSSSCP